MTKQDYIALAAIIKSNTMLADFKYMDNVEVLDKGQFVNQLCGILGNDNPRFDEVTFRSACR